MFTPPIPPTRAIHPTAEGFEHSNALQIILNSAFGNVPTGIPVGGNLAILQMGKQPLREALVLHTPGIAADASQHWGSVSKQFTAACIAKLVASGKLNWDDDVCKLLGLPPFQLGEEKNKKITIDQLLHMRSGLPEVLTLAALAGKDDLAMNLGEKIALVFSYPYLEFEPGSKEAYCNTNYYLLAAIVEKVSGKPFADFVREEVFDPLNMQCRCSVDPSCPPSIDGYNPDYLPAPLTCQTYGATGIIGSPSEMLHWNAALGRGEWNALLEPPKKTRPEENQPVYARGLNITHSGNYRVIHHSGSVGCFTTQFMRFEHQRDPAKTFAFFLTCNLDDIPLTDKAAHDIAVELSGVEKLQFVLPGPPPPPLTVPIDEKKATPYVGTYQSRDLNTTYEITKQQEKGTWVLHLFYKSGDVAREVAAFVPTASGVFCGPIGDTLELTEKGVVIKGAKIAPLHLHRVY